MSATQPVPRQASADYPGKILGIVGLVLAIIGSIVFSLCVSIGEMIAFLYVLVLARFSQHTRLTPITLGRTWAVLLASPICMSTGRSDSL